MRLRAPVVALFVLLFAASAFALEHNALLPDSLGVQVDSMSKQAFGDEVNHWNASNGPRSDQAAGITVTSYFRSDSMSAIRYATKDTTSALTGCSVADSLSAYIARSDTANTAQSWAADPDNELDSANFEFYATAGSCIEADHNWIYAILLANCGFAKISVLDYHAFSSHPLRDSYPDNGLADATTNGFPVNEGFADGRKGFPFDSVQFSVTASDTAKYTVRLRKGSAQLSLVDSIAHIASATPKSISVYLANYYQFKGDSGTEEHNGATPYMNLHLFTNDYSVASMRPQWKFYYHHRTQHIKTDFASIGVKCDTTIRATNATFLTARHSATGTVCVDTFNVGYQDLASDTLYRFYGITDTLNKQMVAGAMVNSGYIFPDADTIRVDSAQLLIKAKNGAFVTGDDATGKMYMTLMAAATNGTTLWATGTNPGVTTFPRWRTMPWHADTTAVDSVAISNTDGEERIFRMATATQVQYWDTLFGNNGANPLSLAFCILSANDYLGITDNDDSGADFEQQLYGHASANEPYFKVYYADVDTPYVPWMLFPHDGDNVAKVFTLTWELASHATDYAVFGSLADDFSDTAFYYDGITDTVKSLDLLPDSTYYVKVRADNSDATLSSAYCAAREFTIQSESASTAGLQGTMAGTLQGMMRGRIR